MKNFDEKKWLEDCNRKMREEAENNPHAIAGFVNGQCIFNKENRKDRYSNPQSNCTCRKLGCEADCLCNCHRS